MKEFILTHKDRIEVPKDGFREFIKEKLTTAGFNMQKSITVKCDKENNSIVYGQK